MAKDLKVGDRVRCYGNDSYGDFHNGNIGVVENLYHEQVSYRSVRIKFSPSERLCNRVTDFHFCQLRRLKKKKPPEFWVCKYALDGHDGYELFVKIPDIYDQKNFVKVRLVRVKDEPTNKE